MTRDFLLELRDDEAVAVAHGDVDRRTHRRLEQLVEVDDQAAHGLRGLELREQRLTHRQGLLTAGLVRRRGLQRERGEITLQAFREPVDLLLLAIAEFHDA